MVTALVPMVLLLLVGFTHQYTAHAYRRCFQALQDADINRDGKLDREFEYIIFLQNLSGKAFGHLKFLELQSVLQQNYVDLSAEDIGLISFEDDTRNFKKIICERTEQAMASAWGQDDGPKQSRREAMHHSRYGMVELKQVSTKTGEDMAKSSEYMHMLVQTRKLQASLATSLSPSPKQLDNSQPPSQQPSLGWVFSETMIPTFHTKAYIPTEDHITTPPKDIPSMTPSVLASQEPSISHTPSPWPSPQPSAAPSKSTMPSDTLLPSESYLSSIRPTVGPSSHPSRNPAPSSSHSPSTSINPTIRTQHPSHDPSPEPSQSPTYEETKNIFGGRVSGPAPIQSASPTNSPPTSAHPSTSRPTRSPTPNPSPRPSFSPSESPSQRLTAAPSTSASPSSRFPSHGPTSSPSTLPSSLSSSAPSESPLPTKSSSSSPSDLASSVPTITQTAVETDIMESNSPTASATMFATTVSSFSETPTISATTTQELPTSPEIVSISSPSSNPGSFTSTLNPSSNSPNPSSTLLSETPTIASTVTSSIYPSQTNKIIRINPGLFSSLPKEGEAEHGQLTIPQCQEALTDSDADGDGFLNEIEYIAFINLIQKSNSLSFDGLSGELQQTYRTESTENGIPLLTGSAAGLKWNVFSHSLERQRGDFFPRDRVCFQILFTSNETRQFIRPSTAPSTEPNFDILSTETVAPSDHNNPQVTETVDPSDDSGPQATSNSPPPPSDSLISQKRELSTVYNSWRISNQQGMTAAMIKSSPTYQLLKMAYTSFVEKVVLGLARERKLDVAFDLVSAQVSRIADAPCRDGNTEAVKCQTLFGEASLYVGGVEAHMFYSKYTNISQAAIEIGVMQQTLSEIDPWTPLTVEGSSYPLFLDETVVPTETAQQVKNDATIYAELPTSLWLIFIISPVVVICVIAVAARCYLGAKMRTQKVLEPGGNSEPVRMTKPNHLEEQGLSTTDEDVSQSLSHEEYQRDGSAKSLENDTRLEQRRRWSVGDTRKRVTQEKPSPQKSGYQINTKGSKTPLTTDSNHKDHRGVKATNRRMSKTKKSTTKDDNKEESLGDGNIFCKKITQSEETSEMTSAVDHRSISSNENSSSHFVVWDDSDSEGEATLKSDNRSEDNASTSTCDFDDDDDDDDHQGVEEEKEETVNHFKGVNEDGECSAHDSVTLEQVMGVVFFDGNTTSANATATDTTTVMPVSMPRERKQVHGQDSSGECVLQMSFKEEVEVNGSKNEISAPQRRRRAIDRYIKPTQRRSPLFLASERNNSEQQAQQIDVEPTLQVAHGVFIDNMLALDEDEDSYIESESDTRCKNEELEPSIRRGHSSVTDMAQQFEGSSQGLVINIGHSSVYAKNSNSYSVFHTCHDDHSNDSDTPSDEKIDDSDGSDSTSNNNQPQAKKWVNMHGSWTQITES